MQNRFIGLLASMVMTGGDNIQRPMIFANDMYFAFSCQMLFFDKMLDISQFAAGEKLNDIAVVRFGLRFS